jgi:hypothetical protein
VEYFTRNGASPSSVTTMTTIVVALMVEAPLRIERSIWIRPAGDCKVMFSSSNRSRVASVGKRP